MQIRPILQTWGRALSGRVPSLSLEITRECPLRCPGCYAYEDNHLGGPNLRSITDYKGEELVRRVLALVDEQKPLHLSIVGGDPLVRYRELEVLLPQLAERGIHVQVVTSAFRPLPPAWAKLPRLRITVSIDGLQPEHDLRRAPATYDRILRNIEGQHIAVHCTVTSAMLQRSMYLHDFVEFWSANPNVEKIWMSLFTPQRGADLVECLTVEQRDKVVASLLELRTEFPKLDMPEGLVKAFLAPPKSPAQCVFARTTNSLSADFKTKITPCQFGGDPDCARCGCIASMGLEAIAQTKVVGPLRAGHLFFASAAVGDALRWFRDPEPQPAPAAANPEPLTQIEPAPDLKRSA